METKLKLKQLVESHNIAELLSKKDLDEIGREVVDGFDRDLRSRSEWESRNSEAIKLALQVVEQKTFPWTNCSNVKLPLVTVGALQFLARVSIMTKGKFLAKVGFLGMDPDGTKSQQCKRVSQHLSLQLLDQDVNWIDDDEKAKFSASILGSSFKKTHYDSITGTNTSEYVPAMNFVVDYYCKHIDKATRATHILHMDSNAIQERVHQQLFLKMSDSEPADTKVNLLQETSDQVEGIQRPNQGYDGVYEILEQHCWLDLDGDDYKEPYIIFCRRDTAEVLRIVARYLGDEDVHRLFDEVVSSIENQITTDTPLADRSVLEKRADSVQNDPANRIVRIDPMLYFTQYVFIPSPDGGFYGLGLGALLGPLNASVNTLLNQLIDNGTMSNTSGGFLGRGVKIKGGKTTFDPFEWKPVDCVGDDLRKNIVPLPVQAPSEVLYKLLGLLITYGEKVSSATDVMTGVNPGQNTPAETSRNTVEQGMMLFSGIYSRMYRAFRAELRKEYKLNQLYFRNSPKYKSLTSGPNAILHPEDYARNTLMIYPAASPEAVSQSQLIEKAGTLVKLSQSEPGFNRYLVTRAFLEACNYDDIDLIYPDPNGQNAIAPPANPKVELEKAKLQQQQQEHQDEMQLEVAKLQSEIKLTQAKIVELQAKAQKEQADAAGVGDGHRIALVEAQIGAAKNKQDGLLGALNILQQLGMRRDKVAASAVDHARKTGAISHDDNTTGQDGMVQPSGNTGAAEESEAEPTE